MLSFCLQRTRPVACPPRTHTRCGWRTAPTQSRPCDDPAAAIRGGGVRGGPSTAARAARRLRDPAGHARRAASTATLCPRGAGAPTHHPRHGRTLPRAPTAPARHWAPRDLARHREHASSTGRGRSPTLHERHHRTRAPGNPTDGGSSSTARADYSTPLTTCPRTPSTDPWGATPLR